MPDPSRPAAPPRVADRRSRRAAWHVAGGLLPFVLGGLALPGLLPAPLGQAVAAPGDRQDHDRARSARQRGDVRPLDELVAGVERVLGARVIDVELDDDDGVPVYEFDLLRPDGQVLKLELDARDGRWLELKGTNLERLFPAGRPVPAEPVGARPGAVAPAAGAGR